MGLDKEITQMAITSCIDWENKSYMESVAHTKHAELKIGYSASVCSAHTGERMLQRRKRTQLQRQYEFRLEKVGPCCKTMPTDGNGGGRIPAAQVHTATAVHSGKS